MNTRTELSRHSIKTDYSLKGRLKSIIIGWVVFLAIFGLTRLPAVQQPMLDFATRMAVPWLLSWVNFFINGLWVMFIPYVVGTVLTLLRKQPYDTFVLYEEGLGFANSKTGHEAYAPWPDVRLAYGSMRQSVTIAAKAAGIKSREYGFGEFTDPETLEANLQSQGGLGAAA